MIKRPKVSILVPVYHVEKAWRLRSILIFAQTLTDIEVLCMDEGEDDACYDILLEYASREPRLQVLHKKHGGYGPALSAGLSLATGEYIGFVDPDDTIMPRMYSELYDYANYIGAEIVKAPWFQTFNDGHESIKNPIYDFPKWRTFNAKDFPQIFALHPSIWSGIYKREFLQNKKINFSDKMFADQKFRINTLLEADHIGWYNKAFYKYTMDRNGSVSFNWNLECMSNIWLEIHNNLTQETYSSISQYIIMEEYLCIFQPSHISEIVSSHNLELFNSVLKCLSYTSRDDIANSPVLDEFQKHYLLELKNKYYRKFGQNSTRKVLCIAQSISKDRIKTISLRNFFTRLRGTFDLKFLQATVV